MVRPRQRTTTTEPRLSLAILAFAGLSGGCASTDTPAGFIDRLRTPNEGVRAELTQLEERVRRLEAEASAGNTENARLRERIAELEATLEEVRASAAAPAPPAPFDPQPPPRVKVVQVSELESDTDRASVGTEADPAASVERTGHELYDQALDAFMRHEYLEAELGFQRFISDFPDTDLSDNALYWIGECRFARGDNRGAATAFEQLLQDFPLGNKVPDALLKAGRSLQRLGDTDGARRRFREVSRRFPDTDAARMAADSLATLDDG
ncbi:MAG: tol-pal system protein YbgF [Acidobacteriota bacterium]|nr:tol-pal system protein YbgF [Acidobacteriota bacterium]MDE3263360.1 tol-pal system protein YbgF [Acidobacteriota bacterium]